MSPEVDHRHGRPSRCAHGNTSGCPEVDHPSLQISFDNDSVLRPRQTEGLVKISALAALAALTVLAASSLPVRASLELAAKSACSACHAPERKILGPAYADVAKKYAGQKDALALLSASIRKGGAGKWGPVPMPAQPALTDADLRTLAAWVLAGAK